MSISTLYQSVKNLINQYKFRIIFDNEKKVGNFLSSNTTYNINIQKEQISRDYILNRSGKNLKFLDIGARDGKLIYPLGIENNLKFNRQMYERNYSAFSKKFNYYAIDLGPEAPNVIKEDVCDENFLVTHKHYANFFDLIYSNNVFEHLSEPWQAAKNIMGMLKAGGICITIVPFSQRYHESPQDYFRYTHTGLTYLFKRCGKIKILENGYDIAGRRNNWQGNGLINDTCPVDKFGAWRETWFTVLIFEKL